MNPAFENLRQLLRRRLEIIADHALRESDPAGQLRRLQEVSEAIQAEHEKLRPALHPRLNHFLTQSSLQKALDWIEQEG
ncbi:MAG TPA: hypothetical protein DIT13_07735 [Verrucomicrobiales bacterium]|nr:hypothetical protein [Verrucomicrobiales bacterium]HRJ09446.1 hypothetical protein [Prosthecobacter sp.]HRK14984.1 hypothetical protein [Prosthecobacter sp.]